MGCFGGDTPTPDTQVQDAMAGISRAEYDDFLKNYSSIGNELTVASTDPAVITDSVNNAVARVDPAFETAAGMTSRNVSRYNMNLTGAQRQLLLKSHNLNKSKTKADVANRSRAAASELQDKVRADTIALGEGFRANSMGDYSTASSLESNRNRTNLDNAASYKASLYGAASSIAGMAGTALILSSRKKKKDIKAADPEKAAAEMKNTDVKNYEYKDGAGPQGERTGAIAEDNPQISNGAKDMVDLGDWAGKLTLSFQHLADEVEVQGKDILKLKKRRAA